MSVAITKTQALALKWESLYAPVSINLEGATLLVVSLTWSGGADTPSLSYGGQAMTMLPGTRNAVSGNPGIATFYLADPPAGANNLVATSGAGQTWDMLGFAFGISGATIGQVAMLDGAAFVASHTLALSGLTAGSTVLVTDWSWYAPAGAGPSVNAGWDFVASIIGSAATAAPDGHGYAHKKVATASSETYTRTTETDWVSKRITGIELRSAAAGIAAGTLQGTVALGGAALEVAPGPQELNAGTLVAAGALGQASLARPGGALVYPVILQPGKILRLRTRFTPSAAGNRSGGLSVVSNAAGSPTILPLYGTGASAGASIPWLKAAGGNIVTDEPTPQPFRLRTVNWYGMEVICVPLPLWDRAYKTVTIGGVTHPGILDQIKGLGFNGIRLPIAADIVMPGVRLVAGNALSPKNIDFWPPGTEVEGVWPQPAPIPSIEILDLIVAHCRALGLRIVLDMHCLAPNPDNAVGMGGRWFTTPTPTAPSQTNYGTVGGQRNERFWIDAWVFLADRYKNEPTVCGFDLANEPHNCTWDNDPFTGIAAAYERCAAEIQAVNPKALIICQGITGNVTFPGGQTWGTVWAGNLTGVKTRPLVIPHQDRLVYSNHEYATVGAGSGPDWLRAPGYPDLLPEVWDHIWGFIPRDGIAPLYMGEFGAVFGPGQTINNAWIAKITGYVAQRDISWAYWCFNEGGDAFPGVLAADRISVTEATMSVLTPMLSG